MGTHVENPILFAAVFIGCGVLIWLLWRARSSEKPTVPAAAELVSAAAVTPATPKVVVAPATVTSKAKSFSWVWFWAIAVAAAIISQFVWHWIPRLPSRHQNLPYHSSVAFGNGSPAVTPDAPVSGSIQAPANESYDPMDDVKTMEGKFSAPITLISQRGLARKLSFNEDHSQPDPSPADVPWIAKCWPVGGGDPFIWNGSNAVSYDHCAFASKTDQPVKVNYWLIDD